MKIKNISSFSLFCFFLLFTLRQITLATPMLYAQTVGTATWIVTIFVGILIGIIVYLLIKLYRSFYGQTLFDISYYIGGKIFYKINSFIYFIVFLSITAIFLKEIAEAIKLLLFNTTPLLYIELFYVVAMLIGSFIGLEGIIRASGYLTPICFVILITILLLSTPFYNTGNLFPILGNGVKDIAIGSITLLSSYLGVLIIMFTIPHIDNIKIAKKSVISYLIFAFISVLFTVVALNLVFGFPYTENNLFSFYELANMTNINKFFQHSEAIYLFSILVLGIAFLVSLFYFTTYCFSSLVLAPSKVDMLRKENNNYVPLTRSKFISNVFLILLTLFLCNLPTNIFETFMYKEYINYYIVLPFVFAYPIILLIIANIKNHFIRRSK
ncbi:MAG: hypothetical protein E7311_07505 [Clostridiales bacterium]|nr:hypothetical protein [Clostridiales bacterium]